MDFTDAKPFLSERRRGVLATIRSSGVPQMSNIVYGVIDDAIWVSVTDDRAKTANVRSDPRAVLHVTSDDFWRYVVVEADVTLTPVAGDPADETVAELKRLYRVVSGEHDDWDEYARAMVEDRRLVMKLTPAHTYGNV